MTTITASSTIGIDLNPAFYSSPIVIGAGVTISNPNYPYGVYRHLGSTTFFTVQNDGIINGSNFTSGVGVYLAPGGSVTNTAGASISGYTGIRIAGDSGTVVNDGGIIGVLYGVKITGGAGTVVNDGSIAGGGLFSNGTQGFYAGAVELLDGGSVTNAVGASIGVGGVIISGGAGTLVNDGRITGGNFGVDLHSGGLVTNASGGLMTVGSFGIRINGGPGTFVNDGSIDGSNDVIEVYGGSGLVINSPGGQITSHGGFDVVVGSGGTVVNDGNIAGYLGVYSLSGATVVNAGKVRTVPSTVNSGGTYIISSHGAIALRTAVGSVTNVATGTLTGASYGVYLGAGGKLTNAGTIIGNNGTAVTFGGTGSNRLALDPGFEFGGLVIGSSSASNILELASAASVGTVTGVGTDLLHFGSIAFDAGAKWSITGIQRGLAGPISGFATGDTIELTGVTATGSSYSGGVLTLDEAIGSATLHLPGSFTTSDFVVHNVATGADVSLAAPCFVAGTRIRTLRGAVAVEALREDDRVAVVIGGKFQPIIWLGHRRVDCKHHPKPTDVWPVCLSAGAFGPGRPFRDLWLSPDHAVFVNGVLIPIRYLLNGRTIRQEVRDAVTYWHVELAEHNVLYAEGVPAESYLDTGNRSAFANGGGVLDLHADFARQVWDAQGCAPLVVCGSQLVAAKERLLVRATVLGHVMTDDPNLSVLVDGKKPRIAKRRRTWRACLRKGAKNVRLSSRIWRPAHTQPDTDDLRTLGVAISRLWLDGREAALDSPALVSGWHEREQDWRWTDGDASLSVTGARELTFEVKMTGSYWHDDERSDVRAA